MKFEIVESLWLKGDFSFIVEDLLVSCLRFRRLRFGLGSKLTFREDVIVVFALKGCVIFLRWLGKHFSMGGRVMSFGSLILGFSSRWR